MELVFPIQTKKGVTDPQTFFQLRLAMARYSEQLFQTIAHLGTKVPIVKEINCHVVAEAYAQGFPDFELTRVSGHFGMLDVRGDQVKQFEHSWCVTPCAPEWVIDVSPFHGALNPFMVHASELPWAGLYRPDEDVKRAFNRSEQAACTVIVDFFKHVRAEALEDVA